MRNTTVIVKNPFKVNPTDPDQVTVDLAVPAQYIDGQIYVPIRSIIDAANNLYGFGTVFKWFPIQQELNFDYGVNYDFQTGKDTYTWYTQTSKLPGEIRIYHGELMVPVYDTTQPQYRYVGWSSTWDAQNRVLTLNIGYPETPMA
ncbi:hypothetical protein LSG31_01505 [Fodinisporobacter ferrooxydans]|uniref:Copper amine oxidase-like N-terminal domain-containing protein n=1 Tax=Fodinisporobacter ferrooxydans TaxID=2901836 RepID=A0ABY4CKE4_9BACL|nr:hypothetical protein LSG31_01505 [Alicyclobacillaceae bacterium MYW30-H2]